MVPNPFSLNLGGLDHGDDALRPPLHPLRPGAHAAGSVDRNSGSRFGLCFPDPHLTQYSSKDDAALLFN